MTLSYYITQDRKQQVYDSQNHATHVATFDSSGNYISSNCFNSYGLALSCNHPALLEAAKARGLGEDNSSATPKNIADTICSLLQTPDDKNYSKEEQVQTSGNANTETVEFT